jgi:universal stress protein A
MLKMQRILAATDFSEYSDEARDYARYLCRKFHAELHLLHVVHDFRLEVPEYIQRIAGFEDDADRQRVALEQEATMQLQMECLPQWRKVHPILLVTRFGKPWLEIIRYAAEQGCDLIVMGTHGRSGLQHTLIGSVAEKVARKAPCPVLTIRPRAWAKDYARVPAGGLTPLPAN